MGYFSNGCEGEDYWAQYCSRCVHGKAYDGEPGACMVWGLHLAMNYDEANNPDSPLHVLIPRDGINNLQCSMFYEAPPDDPEDAAQQLAHIGLRLENLVELAEDFSRQVEREAAAHLKCKSELATLKASLDRDFEG